MSLLGFKTKKQEKEIERNQKKAHDIKNEMTSDILRTKKQIDRINQKTNVSLDNVSRNLEVIAVRIANATGRRKR